MSFSEKFGWSLYSFLKRIGEALMAIGIIVIIIGVCLPGEPAPSEHSARALILCAFFACLAIGIFMIWGGAKLCDEDNGPLFWLRMKLDHKIQVIAILKANKEVRRSGISWRNSYAAEVISWYIKNASRKQVNTGEQIAWDAYRKYAR